MDSGLSRRIGFFDALTIGIGTMIGAGIFVLSGAAARSAGPAAVVSFILAGLAVLPTALSFAELASAFPTAGGPYAFVRSAFGSFAGFITGWSLWVGLSLTSAFYCMGFAFYFQYFFPIPWRAAAVGILAFVLVINALGGASSSRLQTASVSLLLILLFLYLASGWSRLDRELQEPFAPYGWLPVLQAAATVFVSYLGFELIATAAEEVKNPARNLPLATILSVVMVTAIYAIIVFVATGLRSYVDLGQSQTPIADTAEIVLGDTGGILIGAAGLLATVSSANGSIMAASRIIFAMSRREELPKWLSRVHPRWNSPITAIASTGSIAVLALFAADAERLAAAAGFLHLYPFVLVNLTVVCFRRNRSYRPAFKAPWGVSIPLVGAGLSALLIGQIGTSAMMTGLFLMLPGIGLHLVTRLSPALLHR